MCVVPCLSITGIYRSMITGMYVFPYFVDRFYVALSSALEETNCALVACDSK